MRISRWIMGTTLALAAVIPGRLGAQGVTTGAISGTITNDGGIGLDAVQVQVVNRSTGFSSGLLSKATGRYTIPGLEPGTYTITVRRIGFQPISRTTEVALSLTTRED